MGRNISMHHAQDVIAFIDGVHNDPQGIDIEDLIEIPALDIHLAVDAVDALDPALQVEVHSLGIEPLGKPFPDHR